MSSGVQQLQRLHDELDFANAAAAELHVAIQFAGSCTTSFSMRSFIAAISRSTPSLKRARIAERMDHFEELRRQRLRRRRRSAP